PEPHRKGDQLVATKDGRFHLTAGTDGLEAFRQVLVGDLVTVESDQLVIGVETRFGTGSAVEHVGDHQAITKAARAYPAIAGHRLLGVGTASVALRAARLAIATLPLPLDQGQSGDLQVASKVDLLGPTHVGVEEIGDRATRHLGEDLLQRALGKALAAQPVAL